MNSGIYEIRNIATNDFYIGSASDLKNRKRQHFTALRLKSHHNTHMQNSYNKHGVENFVFKILAYCNNALLVIFEQRFIDYLKPTYNKRLTADSNLGIKKSDCARRNMSISRTGVKRNISDEYRKKLSESMKGNTFGKLVKYTDEVREKKRQSMIGKNKGKQPSQSCREAVSLSNKTRKVSDKTKLKMSISRQGRKLSDETKKKISDAKKKYYAGLREGKDYGTN